MENPYSFVLSIKAPTVTPAKQALHEALLEMMEIQQFGGIQVKELCKRAHVSRNTYYAYYAHVDELLEEIEDEIVCRIIQLPIIHAEDLISTERGKDYSNLLDFEQFTEFTLSNRRILHPLLILRPNYRFVEKWVTANKYRFWEKLKPSAFTDQLDLRMQVSVHALLALQQQILRDSLDVHSESIYSIVLSIFRILDDKNQP